MNMWFDKQSPKIALSHWASTVQTKQLHLHLYLYVCVFECVWVSLLVFYAPESVRMCRVQQGSQRMSKKKAESPKKVLSIIKSAHPCADGESGEIV